MEIIKGLVAIFFTMGLPLIIILVIRNSMKNEKSVFSPMKSDVAVFKASPWSFSKFISNTMKNGGMCDLETANTPAEREKFDRIPIYFEEFPIFMKREDLDDYE